MTVNLASTTLDSGVNDQLGTADVYTQTSAVAPLNDAVLSTNDTADVAGFMGLTPTPISSTQVATDVAATQVTSSDVTTVISDNSDLQSSYSMLDADMKQRVAALNSTASNDVHITDLTSEGAISASATSSATSSQNVLGLTGMLNAVATAGGATATLKVSNVAAQSTFCSSLLKASVSVGIPNAYAKIDAGNLGVSVMTSVTKTALKVAVATSNVNLLVNLSNGSLAGSIKAMSPNFLSAFSANFKLTGGTHPSLRAQLGLNISTAFGKINANWSNTGRTTGRGTLNANLFYNASADFQSVMRASLTLSRGALKVTSATVTGIAASALPLEASLGVNVRSSKVTVNGNVALTYLLGNGSKRVYTQQNDGTYTSVITTPVSLGTDSSYLTTLDNSALSDPLAQGAAFNACLKQASADSGSIDPTLDAGRSAVANFPLAALGDLSTISVA